MFLNYLVINAMHQWDTEGRNGLPLGDENWRGSLIRADAGGAAGFRESLRGTLRAELATRADDAELRRLHRDNPMCGDVTVSLEREPCYFRVSKRRRDPDDDNRHP